MADSDSLSFDWEIPDITKDQVKTQQYAIKSLKCQLILSNTQEKVKKLTIRFSGPELVRKHFNVEYNIVLKHPLPEKNQTFSGNSLISISKVSILVALNRSAVDLEEFFIENALKFSCNIKIAEKRVRSTRTVRKTGEKIHPSPMYNSKQETGFVGLLNQGATCYMNSMLQALYSITAFRRMIYNMPTTGNEDIEKSIPLNLQHLFYNMQTSDSAVSTKSLTRSFGWDSIEAGFQQDIQEFCRVLLDNLEIKLNNTGMKNEISQMFRGKLKKIIQAKDCPYTSSTDEYFYDLTLTVDKKKNIYESFESMYEPEEIKDYNTESEYGRRVVTLSEKIVDLPPILFLHLNRFVFDNYGRPTKLNSKFEFPKELDLNKFIENSEDNIYELTGVLVHSGSVNGGHYYAFLRTSLENKWFCFNDSHVTLEKEEAAINSNYGSSEKYGGTSAYYLIYSKKTEISNLFKPILADEIPEHVKEVVKEINAYNEKMNEQKLQENKEIEVELINEEILSKNAEKCEFGFLGQPIHKFKLLKSQSTDELYEMVAKAINKDQNSFRVWLTAIFQIPILLLQKNQVISSIRNFYSGNATVFIQNKPTEEEISIKKNEVVVYIKFFFHQEKSFVYLFSKTVSLDSKISSLFKEINSKIGYPEDDELLAFQELQSHVATKIDPETTFSENLIDSGSILIFQRNPNSQSIKPNIEVPNNNQLAESETAYKYIPKLNTGLVSSFVEEKYKMVPCAIYDYEEKENKLLCKISFPPSITLEDFKSYIAKASNTQFDPSKEAMLLFPFENSYSGIAAKPLTGKYSIREIFCSNITVLFMRLLKDIPDKELLTLNNYKVQFSNDGKHLDFDDIVFMPKNVTPTMILEKLKEIGVKVNDSHYRAFMMHMGMFSDKLDMEKPIPYDSLPVRIEAIPEDQVDTELPVIPVMTCFIDGLGTKFFYGVPFMMKVIDDSFDKTVEFIKEVFNSLPDDAKFTVVSPSIVPEMDQNITAELTAFSQIHVITKRPEDITKRLQLSEWCTECSSSGYRNQQRALKIYN